MNKVIMVVGSALSGLVLLSGCSTPTSSATDSVAPAASVPATSAPAPPPEPAMTTAQEQAVKSAESYLEMGGFSKAGLIAQLTSENGEGFALADATFAVTYLKPDWNAQAVASAKTYLEMGGFSRASLIEQLTSSYGEQFTKAQAEYAVNAVGL